MKVTGYVWIEQTGYLGVHDIGVVCDNGKFYACSRYYHIPELGQEVNEVTGKIWNLNIYSRYVPLTKLHKLLYGIEHEI